MKTFHAIDPPDVATFLQQHAGQYETQKPRFNGLFGVFINLPHPDSPKIESDVTSRARVYWGSEP
jgi:hypothetical protein